MPTNDFELTVPDLYLTKSLTHWQKSLTIGGRASVNEYTYEGSQEPYKMQVPYKEQIRKKEELLEYRPRQWNYTTGNQKYKIEFQ